MSENDLTRVQSDLNTINSALGLPHRRDPREVRVNLLFALAGAVAAAWAFAPHGFSPLIGIVCLVIPVIAWMRSSNPQGRSYEAGEWRDAMRTVWLALPLAALFAWCRYAGLSPAQFLSLSMFLVGAIIFSSAIGQRSVITIVGWAVALMVGGLIIPFSVAHAVAVFAGAIALGGLASAAIAFASREESPNSGAH